MERESKPVLASIILLSLLRKSHTQRCIDSIFKFTPGTFEIIIVDMGYSDTITAWLKRFSQKRENIRVIFNSENVGTARGRNQAIDIASGKYLIFMDNDVVVTESWMDSLLTTAESSEMIGACGAKVISGNHKVLMPPFSFKAYRDSGYLTRIGLELTKAYHKDDQVVNKECHVQWYPTTCLLVKREAIDMVGGFDENLFLAEEDKDLSLNLEKHGYELVYVPTCCIYHIRTGSSVEYLKIRGDVKTLKNDIAYFQQKWGCQVFIDCYKSYLRQIGLSDKEIEYKKRFDFFCNVIDR
ncbi:glycosyltransferase family 2 protein [candidate division CSSED10-310 bacterium]|uniref:Glycosyltransferase family 2 protein n=1 Tax=candidate division CSSED10-310 bacterium TaxID=2855610 RepID=A0ABV6Z0T1_UNCC1